MKDRDMISAFLTGALSPEEMRAFEQKIKASEELEREVLTMQRFFDDMEYPASSDVVEKIQTAAEESPLIEHKSEGSRASKYLIMALISIVLLALIYLIGWNVIAPNDQDPVYVDNSSLVDEPFSSFIASIYATYPPASNLLRSEIPDDTTTVDIDTLRNNYRLAHIAMTDKDWVLADSLFENIQLLEVEESTVSRDAIVFYYAITILTMDSCSIYGRDLLNSIPEREVKDFRKVAKIIEDRIEALDCADD